MFSSDKKLANAVGAKSARACDNCIRKRARWYCAADDAFLCQSCDSSVHSANPLARRHERVRLKTASFKSSDDEKSISTSGLKISVPTWHQGFTRKARTPRQKKHAAARLNPLHLVPEIYSEENSHEENEEQLLYRVPIFDPFVAELCTSANSADNNPGFGHESKPRRMILKIFLRLDYEGVLSAWDDQKSPWTTGERPDLDSGECWPDCVGTCGTMHVYGEMGMMSAHAAAMADGGREARVSRYREKRRTRLFSKKIRYEVRKLNAEKRPRMKGRFVKRSNFVAPSNFSLLNK
ncbi:hypothetical protein DH2020_032152 [Rehmannia glutinosa]|uniref:CONSTANS-like protein n=1 Tax=Rehmannia glutinosa TaxID=99300 RepID=A0ABR0VIX0_REHGL